MANVNTETNKDTSTDTKQENKEMVWDNKPYKLRKSNRIIREDLEDIKDSIFEDIYREADRTLFQIVQDGKESSDKEDCGLNVLSFLGQRGRGKTSAMLSFLDAMENLESGCQWSEFYQDGKDRQNNQRAIQFVGLPYIDAAMLAENEYIFDVILAEMWDQFEEYMKEQNRSWKAEDSAYQEQEIKKAFISVRRAYLGLREREQSWNGKGKYLDRDMPVPGELHELACSLNLRDEMKKLVKCFLELLGSRRKPDFTYLVIPIDDIDMSGDKAWLILEQLRRFLEIPQVIILLTADIERLQKACEAHYAQIYTDKRDRRRFVNEYLEKVLPYNMRMYMPEVSERYDGTLLDIPARREQLKLTSSTEKDMILEFIARECGIWFDGSRRSRHFLQNQSLRSMVNYFEQLSRVYGLDYYAWLKTDLRERLMERIHTAEQREFVNNLFERDYEDINAFVVSFINSQMPMRRRRVSIMDASLGQVLYGCNLLEMADADNVDFVNCIIMWYSIIISRFARQNRQLMKRVLGESLFGEWEYMTVAISSIRPSDLCRGVEDKADLRIKIPPMKDGKIAFSDILKRNENAIRAWAYTLMFVTVIPLSAGEDIAFRAEESAAGANTDQNGTKDESSADSPGEGKAPAAEANMDQEEISGEISVVLLGEGKESEQNKDKGTTLILQMTSVAARKTYFSCLFYEPQKTYDNVKCCLESACKSIAEWMVKKKKTDSTIEQMEEEAAGFIDEILEEFRWKESTAEGKGEAGQINPPIPYQNVEILYSIGQALGKITIFSGNTEQASFDALGWRYREIQKVLLRIDKYNSRFRKEERTDFAGRFNNCFQARLMLGDVEMEADLREKVVKKLGGLLLETPGINITVSDPDV